MNVPLLDFVKASNENRFEPMMVHTKLFRAEPSTHAGFLFLLMNKNWLIMIDLFRTNKEVIFNHPM